jgi:hypothetical protein
MTNLEIWLRYFLGWPGLPAVGDPSQADVVIVQAFGRNDYLDTELFKIRKAYEYFGQNDAQTIAWLRSQNFDPGLPNRQLAAECQTMVDCYGLPVITQWEAALAFDPDWYEQHKNNIICLWPLADPTRYFTTRLVKEQTVQIMRQCGWSNPIELAHKRQVVRSFLIVRKLLGKPPIVLEQKISSFDSGSVQPWTKSPLRWIVREVPTRIHHVFKHWV